MTDQLKGLFDGELNRHFIRSVEAAGRVHILAPAHIQAWLEPQVEAYGPSWSSSFEQALAQPRDVLVFAATYAQEQAWLAELRQGGKAAEGWLSFLLPQAIARRGHAPYFAPAPRPRSSVERRYVVLCIGRVGSNHLCSLLASSGFGLPAEHLRGPAVTATELGMDVADLLELVGGWSAQDGIFGTKLVLGFLSLATNGSLDRASRVTSSLADRGYVLFRLDRDPFDRAVSDAMARAVQVWHAKPSDLETLRARQLTADITDEALAEPFYAGIAELIYEAKLFDVPHAQRFTYEQLTEDPQSIVDVVRSALGPPGKPIERRAPSARLGAANPAYAVLRRRLIELVSSGGVQAMPAILSRAREMTGHSIEQLKLWPEFETELSNVLGLAERELQAAIAAAEV